MESRNIALSTKAVEVIETLRHSCGSYTYYADTLTRLFNLVFAESEEIGMSDTETLRTLRVIKSLMADLAYLAGRDVSGGSAVMEDDGAGQDAPRRMIADVTRAWTMVGNLQAALQEAAAHASQAGERYASVLEDLGNLLMDLEPVGDRLDAVMAIDPETYEPERPTERQVAESMMRDAQDSLVRGFELMRDARDHAARADTDEAMLERMAQAISVSEKAVGIIAGTLLLMDGDTADKE